MAKSRSKKIKVQAKSLLERFTKNSESTYFPTFFSDDSSDTHDWESYLGNKDDPNSSIMIRFPNGNRVTKEIPCSSKFMVSMLHIFENEM